MFLDDNNRNNLTTNASNFLSNFRTEDLNERSNGNDIAESNISHSDLDKDKNKNNSNITSDKTTTTNNVEIDDKKISSLVCKEQNLYNQDQEEKQENNKQNQDCNHQKQQQQQELDKWAVKDVNFINNNNKSTMKVEDIENISVTSLDQNEYKIIESKVNNETNFVDVKCKEHDEHDENNKVKKSEGNYHKSDNNIATTTNTINNECSTSDNNKYNIPSSSDFIDDDNIEKVKDKSQRQIFSLKENDDNRNSNYNEKENLNFSMKFMEKLNDNSLKEASKDLLVKLKKENFEENRQKEDKINRPPSHSPLPSPSSSSSSSSSPLPSSSLLSSANKEVSSFDLKKNLIIKNSNSVENTENIVDKKIEDENRRNL